MKIQVTQQDIDQGIRQDCEACPVTLAAIRAGLDTPVIFETEIWYSIGKGLNRWRLGRDLSPDVTQFIKAFDAGEPVWPFTLTLEGRIFTALCLPVRRADR